MPKLTRDRVAEEIRIFMQRWNEGDLNGACDVYHPDVSLVNEFGYSRGRDQLMRRYHETYQSAGSMGRLTFQLAEFRPGPGDEPTSATAILHWNGRYEGDRWAHGYCLITCTLQDGQFFIVQTVTLGAKV